MQRSIIAPAERVTNLRWGIVALLAAAVFCVSYSGAQASVVALAIATIPAGLALDRFGVRLVGAVAALLWALGSLAALAGVPAAASVLLGVGAAPFLPLAAKATASWFPRTERSSATAIVIAASLFAFSLAGIPEIGAALGGTWPIAGAVLGVLLAGAFFFFYREPDDTRVTYAERQHIRKGGGQLAPPADGSAFAALVRSPSAWATVLAFAAFGFAFGGAAMLALRTVGSPIAWIAALVAGVLVDVLVRRNADGLIARKAVIVIGMLAACAILGVTTGSGVPIAAMTIVLCGYGAAGAVLWTLPGFIAPAGTVGTLAACAGLAGVLGAAAALNAPTIAGFAVAAVIGAAIVWFGIARVDAPPEALAL